MEERLIVTEAQLRAIFLEWVQEWDMNDQDQKLEYLEGLSDPEKYASEIAECIMSVLREQQ